MHGRALGLALAFLLGVPAAAQAASASTNCAGFQNALNNATVAGDVVTLTQDCTGHFNVPNGDITVQGDIANASRILTADSGRALTWPAAGNGVLRNLTITTLAGGYGGVAFTGNSSPTVDQVRFERNDNPGAFGDGGALSITSTATPDKTVTIKDSVFGSGPTDNSAGRNGGAIYVFSSSGVRVVLSGLSINGNHATKGGGVYVQSNGGHVTLRDSDLSNNYVSGSDLYGGGAFLGGLDVIVTANQFSSNQARLDGTTPAVAFGGALYAQGTESAGAATLNANAFTGNGVTLADGSLSIPMQGGAAQLNGKVSLLRNEWSNNSLPVRSGPASGAAVALGGVSCAGSTLRNEFFRDNAIAGVGQGADLFAPCSVDIDNITARGSTVGSGTASLFVSGGAVVDLANSILWGSSGGSTEITAGTATVRYSDVCAAGAQFAGAGNICADPLFADATNPDVQASSPVIEQGSNALVPAGLTTDWFLSPRLIDNDLDCTATVDMGAAEHAVSGVCTPPPVATPPGPTPPVTTPPVTTPPVTTPPVTDPGQVLLCEGRKAVLIDLHRSGKDLVLGGLSLKSLAGKKIKITADHGGGSTTAKIARDGSFTGRVPYPKSDQISYTASYGSSKSSPLKVSRNLTVVSQKRTTMGLRIVARHSKGARVKGEKATVLRQTGCNKQSRLATVTFDKRGEVTYVLPLPKPPNTIAVYRLTTKVNQTYTLPIVVRP